MFNKSDKTQAFVNSFQLKCGRKRHSNNVHNHEDEVDEQVEKMREKPRRIM